MSAEPPGFPAAVAATLRRRRMLKGGERVLVAVSGGPDSVALLGALHALAPAWDLDLHIAHFDHRLRPDSGADAASVAALARELGLPMTSGSASPGAPSPGLSPEEAARERRLRFLEDAAAAAGATAIATGHTLDDQAETVLMRLLTGAGARGLGGIPPVREPYVRPLIDRRRAETEAFCATLAITPRRDPTNEDTALLRNLVRGEVIPALERTVNARLAESLGRTADVLREEDALLDALAAEAVPVEDDDDGARISRDALAAAPLALRRRAVRRALPLPLDLAHVERILDLAERGRAGDALDLPQGLKATLGYGSLLLGRVRTTSPSARPVPLAVPGRTDLPAWGARAIAWEERDAPKEWPDGKATCVMDAEVLAHPLVVRLRRRGDRIAPLGLAGSRSVADVLADAKVPRAERDAVPVVASGDEVVWVVGHRVADRVKVSERTRRFLWLQIEGGPPWRS